MKFYQWLVNAFLRTLVIYITLIKQLLIMVLFFKIVNLTTTSHIFEVKWSFSLDRNKLFGSIQIIWFNPLYSTNAEANIGKIFMRFNDKNFLRQHKYYKLFNRNNSKLIVCLVCKLIVYSYMPDVNNVIWKHNSKFLKLVLKLLSKNILSFGW